MLDILHDKGLMTKPVFMSVLTITTEERKEKVRERGGGAILSSFIFILIINHIHLNVEDCTLMYFSRTCYSTGKIQKITISVFV